MPERGAGRRAPETEEIRRVGIVGRRHTQEAMRTAGELADWLRRRGVEVSVDASMRDARPKALGDFDVFDPRHRYDLVVVLGGDGTLLSVARAVESGVPILGVNLGRLGFLTEIGRHELYVSLVTILAGKYELEQRSMFDVELRRRGKLVHRYRAFNDAVIAKSVPSQIIELELRVGDHLIANYRADGLIIATPNGSTAYNLSAGGPIVYPTLGVAMLTPICPHSLTMRPIVVPDTEEMEVRLVSDLLEVTLTVDGQEGQVMAPRDVVSVRRSEQVVQLVRLRDRTFYDSLRNKLKWGG
ncbi:MAG: NAD(+)/NADH kinase [Acidobacteriota bacterium]